MTTLTHLPVCVYCNTARPADRTGCPTCGRPWIDVRIGSEAPATVGSTVAVAATDVAVATAASLATDETPDATPPAEPPSEEDRNGTADAGGGEPEADTEVTIETEAKADGEDEASVIAPADGAEKSEAPPPPPAAEPETAAVPPPPPPPPRPVNGDRSRRRWLLPAGLAFAIVLVFGAITFVALNRGDGTEPSEAAATTTQLSTTTTALATTAPAATAAPETVAPETTAAEPTTTATTQPPTTTTAVPSAESFEPVGEPIATENLTLRAGAIGPIEFGTSAAEAVGRLVASLGSADQTGIAGTDLGMCGEGDGMWVRFGDLTAIVAGDAATGEFAGFRYEAVDPSAVAPDLATPSGLKIGDTLAALEQTYPNYKIVYQNVDGELLFRLIEDGDLLLWGPITSTESGGKVTGISSPPVCPGP